MGVAHSGGIRLKGRGLHFAAGTLSSDRAA